MRRRYDTLGWSRCRASSRGPFSTPVRAPGARSRRARYQPSPTAHSYASPSLRRLIRPDAHDRGAGELRGAGLQRRALPRRGPREHPRPELRADRDHRRRRRVHRRDAVRRAELRHEGSLSAALDRRAVGHPEPRNRGGDGRLRGVPGGRRSVASGQARAPDGPLRLSARDRRVRDARQELLDTRALGRVGARSRPPTLARGARLHRECHRREASALRPGGPLRHLPDLHGTHRLAHARHRRSCDGRAPAGRAHLPSHAPLKSTRDGRPPRAGRSTSAC